MKTNVFISLDGVDGVGKTTTALMLVEKGFQYHKSPSGIFSELRKEVDFGAKALERYCFYMLAVQHDHQVITELLKNGPVVADRYVASTAAYHFVLDERIRLIHNDALVLKPDFSFHLNCETAIRDERIKDRNIGVSDVKLENNSGFLDRVNEVFLSFGLIYVDTGVMTAKETSDWINDYVSQGGNDETVNSK